MNKKILFFIQNQDPQPPASWTGIRDASKNAGTVCAQLREHPTIKVIGGEDCLYLNIYVPHSLHGTSRNPVMVWIHGGAFHMGSGNDTEKRPDYLVAKDVILVSINYRLGVLGETCSTELNFCAMFDYILSIATYLADN